MAKSERFQIIQSEGNGLSSDVRKVLLDTATGVRSEERRVGKEC